MHPARGTMGEEPVPARHGGVQLTQAVRFSRYGGPDVLEIVEIDDPVPGIGEVVIDVMATGLNPI